MAPETAETARRDWRILIVDDDDDVHKVTRLVLSRFRFMGRGISFASAYSAAEARTVIERQDPFAIILLDVVMEEPDSGLLFVKHIREKLGDRLTRIILRTGQPGQAPENRVIVDYDINDYKAKTELTEQKLITSVVAALRSYADLLALERSRRGLEGIIEGAAGFFEIHSLKRLASIVLEQAVALLGPAGNGDARSVSGFAAAAAAGESAFTVIAGVGGYADKAGIPMENALPEPIREEILAAAAAGRNARSGGGFVGHFRSSGGARTVLYAENRAGLDDTDFALMEVFCQSASVAFDNALLNMEIEDSQREIIFTLGDIVDRRSRETGNHVRRVAEYCGLLGEKLGLGERETNLIKIASSMHDIGKLGIPDYILDKEGILDPAEFEIMKTHTEIGAGMLRRSNRELLRAAAAIALQHHERYDGSGYPSGRKGEEIHLFARITAIADVFDALSHDRVYRKALPKDKIIEYFSGEGRTLFDPGVLAPFLESVDEFFGVQDGFSGGA
jgi:response regulator RpfG family c-di-GMP phosphodiesterase